MLPLDEQTIRASFVNASRKEVSDITLPDLADVNWDRLDYLGWRDRKISRRSYVVIPTTDAFAGSGVVGILLRQAESGPRSRAQCTWCQDVTLPNDVVFYSARRGGASGRNGNTVGTLICGEFECSANVRTPPPMAYIGFDREAATIKRMETLRERVSAFADEISGR